MEQLIELSQTEIKLAFVASCIEGTARALGKSYQEVFERMKHLSSDQKLYDKERNKAFEFLVEHQDSEHCFKEQFELMTK